MQKRLEQLPKLAEEAHKESKKYFVNLKKRTPKNKWFGKNGSPSLPEPSYNVFLDIFFVGRKLFGLRNIGLGGLGPGGCRFRGSRFPFRFGFCPGSGFRLLFGSDHGAGSVPGFGALPPAPIPQGPPAGTGAGA